MRTVTQMPKNELPRIDHEVNIGPTATIKDPRFAGQSTFARITSLRDVVNLDLVTPGIPIDAGLSFRATSRVSSSPSLKRFNLPSSVFGYSRG
jgi:hypothetical protein